MAQVGLCGNFGIDRMESGLGCPTASLQGPGWSPQDEKRRVGTVR